MLPNNKVPAGTSGSVANPATPANPGSVANSATPAAPAVDASKLKELETQASQLQKDVNAIKAASQRREADLQRQIAQQQRDFEIERQRLAMQGMDDEQRKIYQEEITRDQLAQLQEQFAQLQNEKAQVEGKQNAMAFFINNRVPANALTLDGTLEDLVASGYGYLAQRNAELESQLTQQPAQPPAPAQPVPAPASPLPNAPQVDTGASGTPPTTTWADIDKDYAGKGGREKFYTDLVSGAIPPDRLPLTKQE